MLKLGKSQADQDGLVTLTRGLVLRFPSAERTVSIFPFCGLGACPVQAFILPCCHRNLLCVASDSATDAVWTGTAVEER